MHVRLTSDARDDLEHLKEYLEPRSPYGLARVLSAIFTTIEQLESFPFLGRAGEVEGTRELTVPRVYQV